MEIDSKFHAIWFGRDDVPEATADRVFRVLEEQLRRRFGSHLQPTPGTTGILAWRRLQEARKGEVGGIWPTLPPDLQTLIRDTTGQGRFECCPVTAPDCIPDLYALDMTLAYAAGAMALESGREWRSEAPVGRWTHDDADQGVNGFLGYTPAWYRVLFAAPDGWGHVGILPVRWVGVGWAWPRYGEAWAGHQEVRLAIECGWKVEVLERVYAVKPEGLNSYQKPLAPWADRLVGMRGELDIAGDVRANDEEHGLYRAAVRNILLHTIGHFSRGARTVKRFYGGGMGEVVDHQLARETMRPVEGGWEYEDYAPTASEPYLHPEWAALIWADCRTRLLRNRHYSDAGKVEVGALSLPREQIVGFALDCIYATHDPGWLVSSKDKGGCYRLKKHVPGPLPAPRNMADLYRLTGEGQ